MKCSLISLVVRHSFLYTNESGINEKSVTCSTQTGASFASKGKNPIFFVLLASYNLYTGHDLERAKYIASDMRYLRYVSFHHLYVSDIQNKNRSAEVDIMHL